MRRGRSVIVLAGALAALLGPGSARAASYLYVSPTGGVWRWDREAYPDLRFAHTVTPVFGVRAGCAFTEAFSAEVIVLTGTNDASAAGADSTSESLRLTQLELSLLVHFQSLTSKRLYPFLNLGTGIALREGGPDQAGDSVEDDQFAFHLGGGIMGVLDRRFALRLNVRDTFFTDKRLSGNASDQPTVDSLELSLGLEVRFPVAGSKPHRPE